MKKIVLLTAIVIIATNLFFCSSKTLVPGSEVQISGEKKPDWVNDPSSADKKDLKAFVGVSHDFKMENDARADALKDARQQIIDFMGVLGKRVIKEAIVTSGVSADIINPAIAKNEQSEFVSDTFIKTRAKNYHIERWQKVLDNRSVENFFKVYVLVQFDEKDTQEYFEQVFARAKQQAANEKEQQAIQKAQELLNSKSLFEE